MPIGNILLNLHQGEMEWVTPSIQTYVYLEMSVSTFIETTQESFLNFNYLQSRFTSL